jgi:transcription antitermination factor NusG
MRDTIPGAVYVEAHDVTAVHQILKHVAGVILTRDRVPRMEPIPLNDRIPLLKMMDAPAAHQGSWVRLKLRGLYHNDLAFVIDYCQRRMEVDVAVVPRIQIGYKRVKRPQASLFDLERVKTFYGNSSVEQANRVHVFGGQVFKNGLLELSLSVVDISVDKVNPTQSELNLFTQCTDPAIVDAAYRETVQFRVDDRIEVIAGQLRGLEGRLIDVEQRGAVVIRSTAASDPQPVRTPEIRKKFRLGDHVQVISGKYQSFAGFIIDMDDKSATLYCLPRGKIYSTGESTEVSL